MMGMVCVTLIFLCSATVAVTSAADDEALALMAQQTYARVIPCLKQRTDMHGRKHLWADMKFPVDARAHYQDLLKETLKWRTKIEAHSWAGFHGPWIENLYIERFASRPLEDFGGLIPIFIQWTDIHVHAFSKKSDEGATSATPAHLNLNEHEWKILPSSLQKLLRPNVIYVAVTQDDQGLSKLSKFSPNILSLSAGGYGNVPIPLIKDTLALRALNGTATTSLPNHKVGFVGNDRGHAVRGAMLKKLTEELRPYSLPVHSYRGQAWQDNIADTLLNLAPRGFGRTSFRLAEIIQIGRIPVYMYNDDPWLPYAGTNASVASFGLVIKSGQEKAAAAAIHKELHELEKNSDLLPKRLARVQDARPYYTYDGFLQQLELFFKRPLGEGDSGGLLRCAALPVFET